MPKVLFGRSGIRYSVSPAMFKLRLYSRMRRFHLIGKARRSVSSIREPGLNSRFCLNLSQFSVNHSTTPRRFACEGICSIGSRFDFSSNTGNGSSLRMDASLAVGGDVSGFRPLELLSVSLGGCTGMDVLSILRKNARMLLVIWYNLTPGRRTFPCVYQYRHQVHHPWSGDQTDGCGARN